MGKEGSQRGCSSVVLRTVRLLGTSHLFANSRMGTFLSSLLARSESSSSFATHLRGAGRYAVRRGRRARTRPQIGMALPEAQGRRRQAPPIQGQSQNGRLQPSAAYTLSLSDESTTKMIACASL